jgi:hypothetical protein
MRGTVGSISIIALIFVLAPGWGAAETAGPVDTGASADANGRVLAGVTNGLVPAPAPMPPPRVAFTSPAQPATASPGQPADVPVREGLWIGFGLGYGSALPSCDWPECKVDREGSVTGSFRIGGTYGARVLLGVEANVWVKNADSGTNTLGGLTGTVAGYPRASSGFFLKGGLGLAYASRETPLGTRLSVPVGTTGRFTDTGWGFLAGLGYDLRVARDVSITPSLTYYHGFTGTATVEDLDLLVPGTAYNILDVSLGVTFH